METKTTEVKETDVNVEMAEAKETSGGRNTNTEQA